MISFLFFEIPKIMLKDLKKKKMEVGMEENLKEKEKKIINCQTKLCVWVCLYI